MAGPIAGAVVVGVVLTSATVRDTQTYKKFAETNLGALFMLLLSYVLCSSVHFIAGVKTIAAADAASAKMKAFDDKLGVSVAVKNTKVLCDRPRVDTTCISIYTYVCCS